MNGGNKFISWLIGHRLFSHVRRHYDRNWWIVSKNYVVFFTSKSLIQVKNSDYFGVSIDKKQPIYDSLMELSPISGV